MVAAYDVTTMNKEKSAQNRKELRGEIWSCEVTCIGNFRMLPQLKPNPFDEPL